VAITGGDVAAQVQQAVRNALDEVRYSRYCTFEDPFGDFGPPQSPILIGPSYDPSEQEAVPQLDGPEACDGSPDGGFYIVEGAPEITYRYCPCTCARLARFGGDHTMYASTLDCNE